MSDSTQPDAVSTYLESLARLAAAARAFLAAADQIAAFAGVRRAWRLYAPGHDKLIVPGKLDEWARSEGGSQFDMTDWPDHATIRRLLVEYHAAREAAERAWKPVKGRLGLRPPDEVDDDEALKGA